MRVSEETKRLAIAKWSKPLTLEAKPNETLTELLYNWWFNTGSQPCSFCKEFPHGCRNSQDSICPLKTSPKTICAEPWEKLNALIEGSIDWDEKSWTQKPIETITDEILQLCHDMLERINEVETTESKK